MKQIFLLLLAFVGIAKIGMSQNYASLSEVKFTDKEIHNEYIDQVFDCCCYLMQTPDNKKDENREVAIDFVLRWANASTNHMVELDDQIKELLEEREDLLRLYSVFYVNASMESNGQEKEEVRRKALESFERYCFNSSNKVKATKPMKELYQLKSEGDIVSIDDYYALKERIN
ncbi:hypothetical protein [Plebeiibacterium marinum]|uniref:Uncharacterized protein n=1 Tax=Plebeiibacterium marinum TaxID=2992111 RepID=A0AAE3MF94_9BACT|nr:hypothetical protein [Plebeiobacterium marinum]MCW3806898.1 hypothetical protein [Plebeiobacterium marinum]